MAFTYRQTQIVKGMLERGDKQHDIAAFFGVNGGRVAEVATGKCDYPTASVAAPEKLPPPGPYLNPISVFEVKSILEEAIALIKGAGSNSDEAQIAVSCLEEAILKLD